MIHALQIKMLIQTMFEVKENKQKKGFWRRLLERVSCFGHNQRYEDKYYRVIFSLENIDNGVKYSVDQKSKTITTTNNSDITTNNNSSFQRGLKTSNALSNYITLLKQPLVA